MTDMPLGSRYTLGERLGSGGMGEVFRARTREGDEVAVKILRAQLAGEPEILSRFIQERSVMLQVRSPHVVAVRDMVVEGETLAIVMDLVRGRDLAVVKRELGTFRPAEVARLGAAIAEGMREVHAKGIVHRDLKPANILLDEMQSPPAPKVADFGVARICEDGEDNSVTVQAGTGAYMSPEQIRARDLEPSSDVYSLGVLLYELLCGVTPFRGSLMEVFRLHQEALPGRPEGIPDALWDLVMRMMLKEAARRPAMAQVSEELTSLQPHLEQLPAAPRVSAPPAPIALPPTGVIDDATRVNPQSGPSAQQAPAAYAASPGPGPGSPGYGPAGYGSPSYSSPSYSSPVTAPTIPQAAAEQPPRRKRRWVLPALVAVVLVALVLGIGGVGVYRMLDGGAEAEAGAATTEAEPSTASESTPQELPTEDEDTEEPVESASPTTEAPTMPDVIGETSQAAERGLPEDVEVTIEEVEVEDPGQDGYVIATTPEPGKPVGDSVTLQVGRAASSIPLTQISFIGSEGVSTEVGPVPMDGSVHPNSITAQVNSWEDVHRSSFNLGRKFDRLTFTLGLSDTDKYPDASRTVEIYLDQVKVWSGSVTFKEYLEVDLPVKDKLRLDIVYTVQDDDHPVYLATPTLYGTKENIDAARQEAEEG